MRFASSLKVPEQDLYAELETRKLFILALEQQNGEFKQRLSELDHDKAVLQKALQESRQRCAQLQSEGDGQRLQLQQLQRSLEDSANATHEAILKELRDTVAKQTARIQELEGLLRRQNTRSQSQPDPEPRQDQDTPEDTSLSDDDPIDAKLQAYLNEHPEFTLDIEKVGLGWYVFGKPISKKIFLKVVGKNVVARVGGGTKEYASWLDGIRMANTGRSPHQRQSRTPRANGRRGNQ